MGIIMSGCGCSKETPCKDKKSGTVANRDLSR